ncbi:MAG: FAD-binding oxidoreductase [Chloroflexota bacterium]
MTAISSARLDPHTLDRLRAQLRGTVLTPGDPEYDQARALWNAMVDRRPALIARCLGAADVIACVEFARAQGLLLSIKGGGHNIAGLAACDGGLMLDMSRMRGVWVDPLTRTARAQAGCLLADLDRETQVHGLAAVLGFVSTTGIAGLTLGGGFGYLTRRFGWACDTLRSVEVVTADGRVARASERENADLFWALRGGGGNFGVVTSFEYQLFPVGPEVLAGAVVWRAEDAAEVLAMYRELTAHAPPELSCAAALRAAPPAPWIPAEMHGRPVVMLLVCDSGPPDEAERRVAPIKAFGRPVADIVQRRPYVQQQRLIDATQPPGRRNYWKSEFLPGLSPDLLSRAIEHAARMASPHAVLLLFPVGGALNRLPGDHSAVGNRDAAFVLTIATAWERAEDDEANIGWARATWQDLRAFSTGGAYINFQTEDEGPARIRAAYRSNYGRLVEVKAKWDPENRFRVNKNIAPQ